MQARYYSPALGRFLSRDPIGFAGGINLYAYCYGDPVNYSDINGTLAGPPIYMELPYVSDIVGSGEMGAAGGGVAGGAAIGAGGVITLCAADFAVFYCAFHPLGVMLAKHLYPMEDIGCGPAETAANKIRMSGGFVSIIKWNRPLNFTRVFLSKDLHKMLMDETCVNRTYLVNAKVDDVWRSAILSHDGFAFTVAKSEVNGYLIGTPRVVPVRR